MEKLPKIKSKDKKKVKIRKTWTRHPGEKVVPNDKGKRPTKRQLTDEAIEDYGDVR